MKKIIAMIFCLALCVLTFVGCDIDLDSYLDADSNEQVLSPSGDGAPIYTFVLDGGSVSSGDFHFSTIQMSKVSVISGEQKITPKHFFFGMTITSVTNGEMDKVYSTNSEGYTEVYDYTEEQLKALPTITLDGEISVELDEGASVTEVAIINFNDKKDEKTTLEALSELETGEYYIKIAVESEEESKLADSINVFRLIVK
jgi:hypothetical protein